MTMGPAGGSNTPNLEDLLRLGISTAKSGNKQNARMIFQQVLAGDRRNERAWLWLASVEEDVTERRRILKTVLEINPNNANAKKLLAALDRVAMSSEQQSIQLGVQILIGVGILIAIVVALIVIF